MATIQQQVAEKCLARLAESKKVDAEKIEQLRVLLTKSKTPKADDFLKIFVPPVSGDIK